MRYADSTFHDESYSSLAANALVIKCQKVEILLKYLGPTYNNLKCLVNNYFKVRAAINGSLKYLSTDSKRLLY